MRVADISVDAIRHNVGRIRELAGDARVIVVVKAGGYGHGALIAAEAAVQGGAAMIATADLEEALNLRESGYAGPLLCWLHGPRVDFAFAIDESIDIGVNNLSQLEAVAAAARASGHRAVLQFKVDTGLSRNGAAQDEWAELFARGAEFEREGLVHVHGIFSHLANAGEEADLAQGVLFEEAVRMLRDAGSSPDLIHLAASAALFTRPSLRYTAVRVGLAAFGLSSLQNKTSAQLGLIPAMTLRSEIVALRGVPAGTGVSYGFNHVCETPTTLGLVPFGYADGMPRALNGAGAWVTIAGEPRPIVGRIGMDQFIVDVGPLGGRIKLGDPVVLFGDPERGYPAIENWARLLGTINYEILVGIGTRVVRAAVGSREGVESSNSVESTNCLDSSNSEVTQ